jgi:hypothetical protein
MVPMEGARTGEIVFLHPNSGVFFPTIPCTPLVDLVKVGDYLKKIEHPKLNQALELMKKEKSNSKPSD